MKRIYVTSLNRVHDPHEEGDLGKLYVLDWDTHLLRHQTLPTESISIGRSRGARGITWQRGGLVVAGVNNKLSFYDPDTLAMQGPSELSAVKFLHQIRHYKDELHLVSTGNDKLFRYWELRETVEDLSLLKDIIDPYITHSDAPPWGQDHLHFNSIAWDENGDEYHVYNAARMIFNFTKKEVFCHSRAFHSLHDLVITPTHIITNSSADRTTLSIDRKTKDISVIHKNRRAPHSEHNLHGMTRGLALHKDLLFIGSTPGDLTLYQMVDGDYRFISNTSITYAKKESIFDILLDPRDWCD